MISSFLTLSYCELDGGIKLAYSKGKKPIHKGETTVITCTAQNVQVSQILKWKTKVQRDEKTGQFESKALVLKLKHVTGVRIAQYVEVEVE